MDHDDPFPLSRALLEAVLADRVSDRLVCALVWRRLGYAPAEVSVVAATLAAAAPAASAPAASASAAPASAASVSAAVSAAGGAVPWLAGPATPPSWAEAFPRAPEVIAERPASVALTRSVPAAHKQLLKAWLGFGGYRIGELFPRRTRRATAVNWLLAHLAERGEPLPESGPLPTPLEPPADPRLGHPGDPPVG